MKRQSKILFLFLFLFQINALNNGVGATGDSSAKNADCGCSAAVNRNQNHKLKDGYLEKNNLENLERIDENERNIGSQRIFDEMIFINGGVYGIGSDKPVIVADGEAPGRKVKLDGFWLDVHEVSNAQFDEFVQKTGYVTEAEKFGNSFVIETFISEKIKSTINQAVAAAPWWLPVNGSNWRHPTGPDSDLTDLMDHPVVHVSWNDASSYCKWKNNKRLPTEAEWEAACRNKKHDRLFPWGNLEKPKDIHRMNVWHGKFPTENTKDDGYASTCPVWMYPNQTEHGLKNMIGNVWEWVADWWQINHHNQDAPLVNPTGPTMGTDRVKKGGSFMCTKQHCYRYRCGARSYNTPDSSAYNLGFRCASDHPPHNDNDDDNNNDNDDKDIDDDDNISNDDVNNAGTNYDNNGNDDINNNNSNDINSDYDDAIRDNENNAANDDNDIGDIDDVPRDHPDDDLKDEL